jgi:hypothetical protein
MSRQTVAMGKRRELPWPSSVSKKEFPEVKVNIKEESCHGSWSILKERLAMGQSQYERREGINAPLMGQITRDAFNLKGRASWFKTRSSCQDQAIIK